MVRLHANELLHDALTLSLALGVRGWLGISLALAVGDKWLRRVPVPAVVRT